MRGLARVVGELMLTAGAVLLLFVGWQLFGTGIATARAQHDLRSELTQQWDRQAGTSAAGSNPGATKPGTSPPGGRVGGAEPVAPAREVAPAEGRPVAELTIPRLSDSWVVVQGVSLGDLALGPGHYPGTALPGQVGNFAVAGHRATHDQPFAFLDQVRVGDRLIVTTATRVYVYRVFHSMLVQPTQVNVLDAVPGEPGAVPTQRRITLTTCNPRWGHTTRLIVYGVLASTTVRPAGTG